MMINLARSNLLNHVQFIIHFPTNNVKWPQGSSKQHHYQRRNQGHKQSLPRIRQRKIWHAEWNPKCLESWSFQAFLWMSFQAEIGITTFVHQWWSPRSLDSSASVVSDFCMACGESPRIVNIIGHNCITIITKQQLHGICIIMYNIYWLYIYKHIFKLLIYI